MKNVKEILEEEKKRWPMQHFRLQIMREQVFYTCKITLWWMFVAIMIGLAVGIFSSAFAFCLQKVTACRTAHPQVLYLLPLGGLIIVFLYRRLGFMKDPGTDILLVAVRDEHKVVPPLMAPLIFVATIITHFCGGSAGREGAALQMGGSIGNTIGRIFHIKEKDRKVFVMSGMSAAFSAVFGTPMAAAIFPMEMISVGVMHYAALVPCVLSSLVANMFAINMGINPEAFHLTDIPVFGPVSGLKILLLGVCCAVLSVIFCTVLHSIGAIYNHFFRNPYVKVIVGGILVIIVTNIIGSMDYNGAGTNLIERAIDGQVPYYAWAIKIILTGLTLTAGFKGGEIVPAFTTGATFGYAFGCLTGISPSLCAGVGMISVFCGVTNCPIASMLIGFELFGFAGVKYLLLAISISYMLSGYHGLYSEQIIMHSKFHTKYRYRFSRDDSYSSPDYDPSEFTGSAYEDHK